MRCSKISRCWACRSRSAAAWVSCLHFGRRTRCRRWRRMQQAGAAEASHLTCGSGMTGGLSVLLVNVIMCVLPASQEREPKKQKQWRVIILSQMCVMCVSRFGVVEQRSAKRETHQHNIKRVHKTGPAWIQQLFRRLPPLAQGPLSLRHNEVNLEWSRCPPPPKTEAISFGCARIPSRSC